VEQFGHDKRAIYEITLDGALVLGRGHVLGRERHYQQVPERDEAGSPRRGAAGVLAGRTGVGVHVGHLVLWLADEGVVPGLVCIGLRLGLAGSRDVTRVTRAGETGT
jgi:hypothetical protein